MTYTPKDRGFTGMEMGCLAYHNQDWPKLQSISHTAKEFRVSVGFLDQKVWEYCAARSPTRS